MPQGPPYLEYDEMRAQADVFLHAQGHRGGYPVDIEKIVDVGLKIDVVPVTNLKRDHDIDGTIACDGSTIWVDQGIYWSDNRFRYRYTLAHELGHWILHAELLRSAEFDTPNDWYTFLRDVPEKVRGRCEFQAYCMGGLLLVQRDPLAERIAATLEAAEETGATLDLGDEAECRLLCQRVGRDFEVSAGVVIRRGKFDGHWTY